MWGLRAACAGTFVGIAACGSTDPGADGPRVAVELAALTLGGVGDVVWDVEVLDDQRERVWARRVTSSAFGDSAGSAAYVGPCDGSGADNTVRVWVVGLYAEDVTDAGAFASGAASAVVGQPLAFANPTSGGPLEQAVTCRPDGDTAARFDVTIVRPAEQGFFDIAVSFDDVFCSAKLDCDAADLLFDASGARADTVVLGLACTGGPDAAVDTALFMDRIVLDCDGDGLDDEASLTIDPAAGAGNLCTVGALDTCLAVRASVDVDPDTYLYQVASYRGVEALPSANIVFWNVALGVEPAAAACTLRARATGDDAADDDDNLVDGLVTAGARSPYITFDVELGTCGSEALTFGDDDAPVRISYTGAAGTARFERVFGATVAAGCAGGACPPELPGGLVALFDACPIGWSDLGTPPAGPGAVACGSSPCRLCEAPAAGAPTPSDAVLVMQSCPSTWTSEGTVQAGGPGAATCPSVLCQRCRTPAVPSAFPRAAALLVRSCPEGWSDLGTPVVGGPTSARCDTHDTADSCRVCQSP